LRHKSATGTPASTSRKALLTCSSLNLDRIDDELLVSTVRRRLVVRLINPV
jgi:hypothetical protein